MKLHGQDACDRCGYVPRGPDDPVQLVVRPTGDYCPACDPSAPDAHLELEYEARTDLGDATGVE